MSAPGAPVQRGSRACQLVWFDPGGTTGMFVASLRPGWLDGRGDPGWAGLRRAITYTWAGQVGAHARVWVGGRAEPVPNGLAVEGTELPVRLRQVGGRRGRRPLVGSAVLDPAQRAELVQVAQCVELLDLWPDACWGYEDFVPRGGNAMGASSRDFLSPVRLFSALTHTEIAYGERGRVPFVQSASMAKTTATDERLKEAGLYRPGMPHATDAARHVATFIRRARADRALREAAWPRVFKSHALVSTA